MINEHRPLDFSGETAIRLPRIREVPPSIPDTSTDMFVSCVRTARVTPRDSIRSFYSVSHSCCIYSNMSLRSTPRLQAIKLNKTIFPSSLLKIGSNRLLMDRKLQCAQNASNIFYNRAIFGSSHKIAKSDCWLRHARPSVRPSSWNNSAPNRRIFRDI